MLNKARRGLNVGGRCYGYDNIEIKNGDQRSHVEYAINEKQAEVLQLIFQLYSDGQGLRAIVKLLNERGTPSPRAGKVGTGSWSTSAIRTMLRRTRYAGVIEWNRREKTYRGGTKVRLERDDSEILRIEAPHLRIIDEKTWNNVQSIIDGAKHTQHKNVGRPAVYLLSGIARCSECDGPLTVINHKSGKNTLKVYACSYHRNRGNSVCTNTTRRPVDSVNESLVKWIHSNVLTEQLVTDIVRRVRIRLDERAKATAGTAPELQREANTLRAEVTRLAEAIAAAGHSPTLLKSLTEREERLAQVDAQLRAQKAAPEAILLELKRLEVEARKRIADLQGALSRNPSQAKPSQARPVVQALLADGRLTATPIQTEDGPRFQLEGEAILGPLLTGEGPLGASAPATRLVPEGTAQDGGEKQARRPVTKVASPTGFESDGTCRQMPSNVAVW